MKQTHRRHEFILKGPRLTLRLGTPEDAPAVLDFYRANREHFAPTAPPRPSHFYTEVFWIERLTASILDYESDRSCQLLVFADGDETHPVIGYTNLSNIVRGAFHACYLGYAIAAQFQGKGMMTEALTLAIHHAFDKLRIHRIMANYLPTNERSAHVLRRLGFVEEGYARDYLFINGAWRDHVLTSLTNVHWEAPTFDRNSLHES